ncbi:MAG TPA: hypothetical protein VJ810_06235 [Blastocatellia bacterium]|nr:hypothetical protein [Blastocatellia bacterium]
MKARKQERSVVLLAIMVAVWAISAGVYARQEPKPANPAGAGASEVKTPDRLESLPAAEFSRLVRDLSEDGGYFRSDNFTSNETAYLTIVDKLRQHGASGGAYIGVGPEQNFTYIAKIRPQIAFIVDIRRQAIIQHLMYKAIFHLSPDRVQFLSRLFSRPLSKDKTPKPSATIHEIIAAFSQAVADEKAYTANLAAIRKVIEDEFQFPLSGEDPKYLDYVYRSFRQDGLDISYRMDDTRGGYFPTLKDLIIQTDLNNKLGNFLASNEDYDFVRNMHRKNLIIPVVGDFGGKKALRAVGDYLRKNGFTVTAFYTSNVEQYLFQNDAFTAFANNVRTLPISDRSLFIRSATGRFPHPARLPNHRASTLLQQMTIFLKDFDEGSYKTYYELISIHYIGPDKQ